MKKYNKPTVEVVNLKSSESIATSFKDIKNGFISDALEMGGIKYAVSKYTITQSMVDAANSSSDS